MRALLLGTLLLIGCGDLLPSDPCQWCYAKRQQCEVKRQMIEGRQMLVYSCLVPEQVGMKPLGADGGAQGQ